MNFGISTKPSSDQFGSLTDLIPVPGVIGIDICWSGFPNCPVDPVIQLGHLMDGPGPQVGQHILKKLVLIIVQPINLLLELAIIQDEIWISNAVNDVLDLGICQFLGVFSQPAAFNH